EIDPFTAHQLAVVKGAQAVRYGADALGGVILASADDIDLDRDWKGNIDLIGQSNGRGGAANAVLEGGVKTLPGRCSRIQASKTRRGNYQAPDYVLGNTGVNEFNDAETVEYKRGRKERELYWSHFGTQLGIFEGAHRGTIE